MSEVAIDEDDEDKTEIFLFADRYAGIIDSIDPEFRTINGFISLCGLADANDCLITKLKLPAAVNFIILPYTA